MKSWFKKSLKENIGLIAFILFMVFFRSALADWSNVPTGSMLPTIVEGDYIFIDKIAYDIRVPFTGISLKQLSNPQRGDIVTIASKKAGITLVKRVIGVPGDKIEMINNMLIINGEPAKYRLIERKENIMLVEEDLFGTKHMIKLIGSPTEFSSFDTVTIPENQYLMLGDNRNNSSDSRVYGFFPRHEIRGRSKRVLLSLDYDNHYIPRTNRFFKELL